MGFDQSHYVGVDEVPMHRAEQSLCRLEGATLRWLSRRSLREKRRVPTVCATSQMCHHGYNPLRGSAASGGVGPSEEGGGDCGSLPYRTRKGRQSCWNSSECSIASITWRLDKVPFSRG